jgi:hypothetical protein
MNRWASASPRRAPWRKGAWCASDGLALSPRCATTLMAAAAHEDDLLPVTSSKAAIASRATAPSTGRLSSPASTSSRWTFSPCALSVVRRVPRPLGGGRFSSDRWRGSNRARSRVGRSGITRRCGGDSVTYKRQDGGRGRCGAGQWASCRKHCR